MTKSNRNQQRRSQRNRNKTQQRRSQRNRSQNQQRRSQRNRSQNQQRRNRSQNQQRRSQRNRSQHQQRRSQNQQRRSQRNRSRKNKNKNRQRGGFSMLGSSGLMGTDLIGKCGSNGEGGAWITDWDEMSKPNSLEEGDIKSCEKGSLDMITGAEAGLDDNAEDKLSALSDATASVDVSKDNEQNLAANRKLASIQELKSLSEKNNDYDSLYAKYNAADGSSENPYLTDDEFDYFEELSGTDGLGDKSIHETAEAIWKNPSDKIVTTIDDDIDIYGIGPTAAKKESWKADGYKKEADVTSAVQKELSDAWDKVKDSSKLLDAREVAIGSLDASKWTPEKQTVKLIPTKKAD